MSYPFIDVICVAVEDVLKNTFCKTAYAKVASLKSCPAIFRGLIGSSQLLPKDGVIIKVFMMRWR